MIQTSLIHIKDNTDFVSCDITYKRQYFVSCDNKRIITYKRHTEKTIQTSLAVIQHIEDKTDFVSCDTT